MKIPIILLSIAVMCVSILTTINIQKTNDLEMSIARKECESKEGTFTDYNPELIRNWDKEGLNKWTCGMEESITLGHSKYYLGTIYYSWNKERLTFIRNNTQEL